MLWVCGVLICGCFMIFSFCWDIRILCMLELFRCLFFISVVEVFILCNVFVVLIWVCRFVILILVRCWVLLLLGVISCVWGIS